MRIQFYVLTLFRPCKTMLRQLKTGEGVVCYTAVFSVVTQRSSPPS